MGGEALTRIARVVSVKDHSRPLQTEGDRLRAIRFGVLEVFHVDSQDLHFFGVSVYGLLHLEQCKHFNFDGLAVKVQIDEKVSDGHVKALQLEG